MEEMFNNPTDQFDSKFRGSFGRFGTKLSHPAYYFMTAVPIKKLKATLQVAADALPIDKIEFSQMIQRDVNITHVNEIKKYIVESSGRSVFFPPLLVSILSKNAEGEIQESFEKLPAKEGDATGTASITWDSNLFRIKLYGSSTENDKLCKLSGIGADFYYHDFGAHLELNTSRSSLVVIDGQHRYKALSSLYDADDTRAVVETIEVPICVVFSPFAVGKDKSGLGDLRDLFITVNNESNRVSGHFIQLLDDKSYSSEAVRSLAELWKNDVSDGYSRLHHLEWNIHDSKRAGQLNRPFSITSVSIIHEALKSSLFVPRVASIVLQLSESQEQLLELDGEFDIDGVGDAVADTASKAIIRCQIEEHVAKPLSVLFSEFRPYAELREKMKGRMEKIASDKRKGDAEAEILYGMFSRHQIPSDLANIALPQVRSVFKVAFDKMEDTQLEHAPLSRLAVFQQALIRSWVAVSKDLIKQEILPAEAAKMLLAALEKTVLPGNMQFLSSSSFTQRMLWNGDKVIFKPDWAKYVWSDLMLSTLGMKGAIEAAIASLEKARGEKIDSGLKQGVINSLRDLAKQRVSSYLQKLEEELPKFYRSHYSEVIQDEAEVDHLKGLFNSGDPDDKKKFVAEIAKLATKRYNEAQSKLLAYVTVKPDELLDG